MKKINAWMNAVGRRLARPDLAFYALGWLIVMVSIGTIAQKYIGLYLSQKLIFHAWITWLGSVPVPGALTAMGVLIVGLSAKLIWGSVWSRAGAGIIIAHLGAWLLLVGGVLGILMTQEGSMVLSPTDQSHHMVSYHSRELVVTRMDTGGVVDAIPFAALTRGTTHSISGTPITLQVVKVCRHCTFALRSGDQTGYQGRAKDITIEPAPLQLADEANQSAIEFAVRGSQADGIYFSVDFLSVAPEISASGLSYRIALEKRKTPLPFAVELVRVTKEVHPGTDMARAYQSEVIVHDQGAAWPATITMNAPLRYRGWTLYQSGFIDGDEPATVLAVVDNPGRWVPYIASCIMGFGLLLHFLLRLPRRALLLVAACLPMMTIAPAQAQDHWDYTYFRSLPVLDTGRVKPIDTYAEQILEKITGQTDINGRPAYIWLAQILFAPEQHEETPIFLVRSSGVRAALGLPNAPGNRYHYKDLSTALRTHVAAWQPLLRVDDQKTLTPDQRQMLEVLEQVQIYGDLTRSLTLFFPLLAKDQASYFDVVPGRDQLPKKVQSELRDLEQDRLVHQFRPIPSTWGPDWFGPWGLIQSGQSSPHTQGLMTTWQDVARAYRAGDQTAWQNKIADLRAATLKVAGSRADLTRLQREVLYHQIDPMRLSLYLYMLVIPLVFWARPLAWAVMTMGASVHVLGILARMDIMDRPPVTNLYASVVFVGVVVVLMMMIYAARHRSALALALGAGMAAFLHIVGFGFRLEGDQLGVVPAVLDTNFWLATHVVVIACGYAAAILAGGLAHIHLWSAKIIPDTHVRAAAYLAVALTAIGTLLGGVWADQSWGRFWGWDPKENGALLIVLWLLFVFHGRYAGILPPRLQMSLLALTPIIVALAWFGVNMLGIGLHSYGFTQGVMAGLVSFIVIEGVLVACLSYKRV